MERKRKIMKRTICTLLTAVLLLSMFPAAYAAAPFTDVAAESWYIPYLDYCYENGLMNGVTETEFQPDAQMTRGMLVTVLYRIAGEPASNGVHPFTDVALGSWYENAISWAYECQVVNGTSATTFSPDSNITREDMVTIFYRYAHSQGLDVSCSADFTGYSDAAKINTWAEASMAWAVSNGIIQGISASELNPLGNASRAECAAIITRYASWRNKQVETDGIDLAALEQYGRDYAYKTYGYDGNPYCTPDTGAGYFPEVDATFSTMEEGMRWVRESVDYQYESDLSAGIPITVNKDDGSIGRCKLNISIISKGDYYEIWCYYGGTAEPFHQDYWKGPNDTAEPSEPSTEATEPPTEATTHTHSWVFSRYKAESPDADPYAEVYRCETCGEEELREISYETP